MNQDKSRLTTLVDGFAFLGFEFRRKPGRKLLLWPRDKACRHIRERVRELVRSFPWNEELEKLSIRIPSIDTVSVSGRVPDTDITGTTGRLGLEDFVMAAPSDAKTQDPCVLEVKSHKTGVSSNFLGVSSEQQFQLGGRGLGDGATRVCLREDVADSIGQCIEPEGWNAEESLRDDQQFFT